MITENQRNALETIIKLMNSDKFEKKDIKEITDKLDPISKGMEPVDEYQTHFINQNPSLPEKYMRELAQHYDLEYLGKDIIELAVNCAYFVKMFEEGHFEWDTKETDLILNDIKNGINKLDI